MANPDGKKIHVLVVDDVVETRENLKKLLYFEDDIEIVGTASNGREGVEQAAALHPDIVLMDINMPGMDGIAAGEQITSACPDAQVIIMSVQGESDYLRRAMLAGAREFLIKPFSSDELITSLRRVHQLAATRRASRPTPTAAEMTPPPPPTGRAQTAKIIAVYSPKGGAGVTTVAVNLAIALREETKQRVAILDGSYQFGDVGVLLNLPTNRSISDIVDANHEPDDEILNGVLAAHSTNVKALLAPPRPEQGERITADHIRNILAVMQKMFDYIVVDTEKAINDQLLAVLDIAEQIILISNADIAALKSARLFLQVTEALDYLPTKTILILNRYDGRSGISARDIEGNMKHPVAGSILRDDRLASAALNRGIPIVVAQRGAPISQSIFALARLVRRPEPAVPIPSLARSSGKQSAGPAGNLLENFRPRRRRFLFF